MFVVERERKCWRKYSDAKMFEAKGSKEVEFKSLLAYQEEKFLLQATAHVHGAIPWLPSVNRGWRAGYSVSRAPILGTVLYSRYPMTNSWGNVMFTVSVRVASHRVPEQRRSDTYGSCFCRTELKLDLPQIAVWFIAFSKRDKMTNQGY